MKTKIIYLFIIYFIKNYLNKHTNEKGPFKNTHPSTVQGYFSLQYKTKIEHKEQ